MSGFEHSITVSLAPDKVFQAVSDFAQLLKYVLMIRRIEQTGERVRIKGNLLERSFSQLPVSAFVLFSRTNFTAS